MQIRDIAFASLKKRRGRTILLMASVAIAVAMIVCAAAITDALQESVESKLREFGANMVVMPKSLEMPIVFGGVNVARLEAPTGELTEEDAILVSTIERRDTLMAISPKLVGAIRVADEHVMLVGVRFRDELRLKRWWKVDAKKLALSRDLVLGIMVARALNKGAGDTVTLGGKEFRIAAVLEEQWSSDDRSIFVDLREAGLLLAQPGRVSVIEVSTWCAACPIETVAAQISAKLPHARVVAVKQLVEAELFHVKLAARFAALFIAIIITAGSLIMLLAAMSGVRERSHEIAVLRAIGFDRYQIARLFLGEGAVIGAVGGIAGAIAGCLVASLLAPPLAGLHIKLLGLRFAGMGLILAVAMATLPVLCAVRAACRIDPATALRAV